MSNDEYRSFERRLYEVIFDASIANDWDRVGQKVRALKSMVHDAYTLGYERGKSSATKQKTRESITSPYRSSLPQ